jgi:hypothetical protein|tara:strand:- start:969 stop:1334 length:366 start_codon:yes stop_codon:yes gene_type:complete
METKKEIIDFINTTKGVFINNINTSYSNINKSKDVWWFNIRKDKFNKDVHLLLNSENKVIWIKLKKGFIINPNKAFKLREDIEAYDIEISANRSFNYLKDIKSGGTNFNFKEFIEETIQKQ